MSDIINNSGGETKAVRIFFSKTDRAKYISHLDLNRTMQRAVKRSRLPVWETEGFNPHIYLTFALPLSLGIESLCESMDIKLTEATDYDEIKERLNKALPNDLHIISAAKPKFKHTEIKKAEYEIISDISTNDFSEFLNRESIIIKKKTKKKGLSEIDLKPLIEFVPKNDIISLLLPAGTELNINPFLVLEAYEAYTKFKPDLLRITRTGIYAGSGERFI